MTAFYIIHQVLSFFSSLSLSLLLRSTLFLFFRFSIYVLTSQYSLARLAFLFSLLTIYVGFVPLELLWKTKSGKKSQRVATFALTLSLSPKGELESKTYMTIDLVVFL